MSDIIHHLHGIYRSSYGSNYYGMAPCGVECVTNNSLYYGSILRKKQYIKICKLCLEREDLFILADTDLE